MPVRARIAMLFAVLLPLLVHALPASAAADGAPASYRLAIRLDPTTAALSGEASITLNDGAAATLLLDTRYTTDPLTVGERGTAIAPRRDGGALHWAIPAGPAGRTMHLIWRGTLDRTERQLEHRDTLGRRVPTAAPEGSFLPAGSLWYPLIVRDGEPLPHAFTLVLDLPDDQRGLVPGALRQETTADGRVRSEFAFPQPAEGIDLVAGPYRVKTLQAQSIDGRALALRTYFHAELDALADGYLESVRDYIAYYEQRIGPYPFDGFAVVSSPTPTGFGMPGFTYLGIEVLRLPFIRFTSLGHEVLHNWWGNGVYPDYARGNWSEGLTTFMADYAYALRDDADKARAMRLGWLRDLSAIPPGDDRPLAEFTSRRHGISQAVGYGKAAMLFVMLRDQLGEPAFDRGLQRFWREQRFRSAGWRELRAAFEAESGQALDDFFAQWLGRAGLPELTLADARQQGERLTLTLSQAKPPYALEVPLTIETDRGTVERRVRLDSPQARIEFDLDATARRVTLDPDSRLLRRLALGEAPPILREVQLDRDTAHIALGDAAFTAAGRNLAARLLDHAPDALTTTAPAGARSLLVTGPDDAIERWLAEHALDATPPEVAGKGDSRAWTLRLPSGAPVALVAASSAGALTAAARPLPHYRQQSWLVFDGGRASARGIWPARAVSVAVTHPPLQ